MHMWHRTTGLLAGLLAISVGCAQRPDPSPRHDLIARVTGPEAGLAAPGPDGDRKPGVDPPLERASFEAPLDRGARPDEAQSTGPLTLEEANRLALRHSPILKLSEASIDAALGNLQVVDSAFLPSFQGNYGFQAFSSQVGFAGTRGRFPVLPVRGFGPGTQDFNVAEVQMKWTIFQFGRLLTKQSQAEFKTDVARLELERSHQTVGYAVARTYFQVLEAKSAFEIAEKAVEQAEAYRSEAGDLLRRGSITREEFLRVDAGLASVRQLRADAKSEEEVAVAALNQTMGINVNTPTSVAERKAAPKLEMPLKEALQLAVANRREIPVVMRGIAIARGDVDVARTEFLPSVSIQAGYSNVTGTGVQNANVGAGGIFISQDLYTGGKRRGQLRTAQAGLRAAEAQAQQVCDLVAFEVNAAYRGFEDARERIEAARAVFDQARENLRLVKSRYSAGGATPAEVIEARASDTKSEQTLNAAVYQYQRALARLEFAVGGPLPTSAEEVPTTTPEPKGENVAPPPPGEPSPFRLRPEAAMPGLPAAPDFGAPRINQPQAPGVPRPLQPESSTAPGLFGPPALSRPPYESTSPFGPKP